VLDIASSKFQELVDFSKKNCPVSKALAGVSLTVNAKLVS
jgi:organic hydroperoxide reductase OsmC/OhrA